MDHEDTKDYHFFSGLDRKPVADNQDSPVKQPEAFDVGSVVVSRNGDYVTLSENDEKNKYSKIWKNIRSWANDLACTSHKEATTETRTSPNPIKQ